MALGIVAGFHSLSSNSGVGWGGWGELSTPGSSETEFQEEGAGSKARQALGPQSP